MQLFVKCALWRLIKAGAWSGFGTEGLAVQVCALRHELFAWYKTYKDEELTRVADFVPSMIGKQHKGHLKTKGAETYGLLLFTLGALSRYQALLPSIAARLVAAGEALKNGSTS